MYILEDYWRELTRTINHNDAYKRQLEACDEAEQRLLRQLNPEEQAAYQACCQEQSALAEQEEQSAFIQGVQFGAKVMLDIFRD